MTIRLYTTPTCPYCRLVKDFLKEKKLAFEEIDVTSDHHSVQEMVKLSGQMGVPVVDIDGKIIVGWNKAALEETINARLKKKVGQTNQPLAMAA
jgi:glutaredoxin-like YruB-family protein